MAGKSPKKIEKNIEGYGVANVKPDIDEEASKDLKRKKKKNAAEVHEQFALNLSKINR